MTERIPERQIRGMPLTQEQIEALRAFYYMSDADYNAMKGVSPLITTTTDQVKKLLA